MVLLMALLRCRQGRWTEAHEVFESLRPLCRGRYAPIWAVASLASAVLEPDFDARLQDAVDLVEAGAGYNLAHVPNLVMAAERADAEGLVARAAAIRAFVDRFPVRT